MNLLKRFKGWWEAGCTQLYHLLVLIYWAINEKKKNLSLRKYRVSEPLEASAVQCQQA